MFLRQFKDSAGANMSYVVAEGPGGTGAVIDPTGDLSRILKTIESEGMKIEYILNTHGHPDHLDGNAYFLERSIKVALSEEEGKFLQTTGKDFFKMFGLEQPSGQIDISLTEGPFKLNDIELEVLLTPGHSPGSICLYWPEQKALVSGDVVFSQSIGRTDFPGCSGEAMKKSIERLSSLDVEYLLPGHNEIVQGKQEVKRNFEFIKRAFFSHL